MSKYCLMCGKEKTWENPFIEGEPITCDYCMGKLTREISKSRKYSKTVIFVKKSELPKHDVMDEPCNKHEYPAKGYGGYYLTKKECPDCKKERSMLPQTEPNCAKCQFQWSCSKWEYDAECYRYFANKEKNGTNR